MCRVDVTIETLAISNSCRRDLEVDNRALVEDGTARDRDIGGLVVSYSGHLGEAKIDLYVIEIIDI